MNEIIKEKVRLIFRTAGMLNFHITRGNVGRERILEELKQINYLSKQVSESIIKDSLNKRR